MGPIWGRQDPGGPHVGPMIFAIWGVSFLAKETLNKMYSLVITSIYNYEKWLFIHV